MNTLQKEELKTGLREESFLQRKVFSFKKTIDKMTDKALFLAGFDDENSLNQFQLAHFLEWVTVITELGVQRADDFLALVANFQVEGSRLTSADFLTETEIAHITNVMGIPELEYIPMSDILFKENNIISMESFRDARGTTIC